MNLQSFAVPGLERAYYIPNFVSGDEEAYLIRKITESPQQKWKIMPNRRLQTWGLSSPPVLKAVQDIDSEIGGEMMKDRLLPQPMPPYIMDFPGIIERIRQTGAFSASPHGRPNHVILNEYLPGQGIMPHEDGPSYHPVVATLSLSSHAVFHYYQYKDDGAQEVKSASSTNVKGRPIDPAPVASVLLEARSLIITSGDLYTSHLHGIDEVQDDVFAVADAMEGPPPPITNIELLGDDAARRVVRAGGTLKRDIRYSLTCRDVERVMSAAGLAISRR